MAAVQERSDAGAKVTVACKLPAGIVMRRHVKKTEHEAVLGGGTRDFEVFRWNGEEVEIKGTAVPLGQLPKAPIVAGYALTHNVSKELFDNWFEANKDGALVRNNLIFAFERSGDAQAEAKNSESVLSGFEPIDPENPGKKIRGIAKGERK